MTCCQRVKKYYYYFFFLGGGINIDFGPKYRPLAFTPTSTVPPEIYVLATPALTDTDTVHSTQ
jgi:hypothetical protein